MGYTTHKRTAQGKAQTLERRQLRTSKYNNTAAIGKRAGK